MNTSRRSSRKSACRSSQSCTRELAVVTECQVVPVDTLGVSRVLAERAELQPEAEPKAQPSKKSTKHLSLTFVTEPLPRYS